MTNKNINNEGNNYSKFYSELSQFLFQFMQNTYTVPTILTMTIRTYDAIGLVL